MQLRPLLQFCTLSLSLLSLSISAYEIRIDCHPDSGANRQNCLKRGCVWKPYKPGIPWCIFNAENPRTIAGYDLASNNSILTRRTTPSLFGRDYTRLSLRLSFVDCDILRIEIDRSAALRPDEDLGKYENCSKLHISVQRSPFGLTITRKSSGAIVFDTANLPGFVFSEQFVQFSTRSATGNVYGLGEQWHPELRRDFNWKRYSMFTADHAPVPDRNLYGFQPFYLGLDSNNDTFGVFLNNTHPMDAFLQPDPNLITFRVIGGNIDLYILSGPTGDNVVQQYTSLVGRPALPPFWALGFQLSRFGYRNLSMLEQVYNRNRLAGIPQDAQVIDIDYMDKRLDFTFSPDRFKGLPEFVTNSIHASGRKLVTIIDPGIASRPSVPYPPLQDGLHLRVFIRDNDTSRAFEGKVWPGYTYWPDFTAPHTAAYWERQLSDFHEKLPFDGIWLDMNDPSNFLTGTIAGCAANRLNNPPFIPVDYSPLYQKTLCLDAWQHAGSHYEWHNMYGHQESVATFDALASVMPGQRPYILTRSTSPGTGRVAAHWMGDSYSDWANLNQSLVALLEFNMFGIPFSGSDICGFNNNSTEELCLRWSQVGAFYPFSRNHNSDDCMDQDPAAWSQPTVNAIRSALLLRYALLPHLYTLLYTAHTTGSTVVKPLFFAFPHDSNTWNLHDQILWGDHLMIAPILAPSLSERSIYFPMGVWYNVFDNYAPISAPVGGQHLTAKIANDSVGLFLRGGGVVVWQLPDVSTQLSRAHPFGMSVAPDSQGNASGSLFWDDGLSADSIIARKYCFVEISCKKLENGGQVTIQTTATGCPAIAKFQFAHLAGISAHPKAVLKDGRKLPFTYNEQSSAVFTTGLDIDVKRSTSTVIKWLT